MLFALMITIVALGDSTTAGTPSFKSPIEAPPNGSGNVESQYAHWLMQMHPDWQVLNRGINGERADQIGARFARDAAAATPMPQWTAEVSAARPDLRRYDKLIATMRNASNPSRSVMTSA